MNAGGEAMDTQPMNADHRSVIMMRGSMWAYNFLVFALLFDIMYRAMVWHEAAWDLYALLYASGVLSLVYAIRHKGLILNRNNVMAMSFLLLLAAIVAAVVAFAYTIAI
jgi:hypothetical protein